MSLLSMPGCYALVLSFILLAAWRYRARTTTVNKLCKAIQTYLKELRNAAAQRAENGVLAADIPAMLRDSKRQNARLDFTE